MDAALRRIAHVSRVVGPHDPGAHDQISKDGHLGFSVVQFDEGPSSLPNSAVKEVVTTAQSFAVPGYYVAVGGQVVENVVSAAPGSSEGIGITAAIIIMLIAFGSVVAMGLPILTALFGVAIGFAVEDLVSHLLNVPTFSPELLAMIGLGVGIDYALFIVTRYRQGLAQGLEPRRAVVVSLATSGRAVLFAGTTVIISLCGLFIVDLPFMVGLAVSAIAGVVLVMAGALTLLPALLGFAGRAIDRLHIPGLLVSGAPPGPRSFWSRWSRVVQRHPWTTGGGALLVLVVLAIPLFSMRLAFTDAGNDPTTLTTRQAFDLLAEGFGPGFNGPLLLAAELPPGIQGTATVDRLDADLAHTPGWPMSPRRRSTPRRRRGHRRVPDRGPPGGGDRRVGDPPSRGGDPCGHPGHGRTRGRRRADRCRRRRFGVPVGTAVLGDRHGDRGLHRPVDGGVPLHRHSPQGGRDEPPRRSGPPTGWWWRCSSGAGPMASSAMARAVRSIRGSRS